MSHDQNHYNHITRQAFKEKRYKGEKGKREGTKGKRRKEKVKKIKKREENKRYVWCAKKDDFVVKIGF